MPQVGIERLGAGDREYDRGQGDERHPAVVEEEPHGIAGREPLQDLGMLGDLRDPDDPEHGEPDDHHRAEEAAHQPGAVALDHEQRGQHGDRHRQDQGTGTGLGDLKTLDRGQHRDRWGDHPVPEEQRGAEDAKDDQRPLRPALRRPDPVKERSQRQIPPCRRCRLA